MLSPSCFPVNEEGGFWSGSPLLPIPVLQFFLPGLRPAFQLSLYGCENPSRNKPLSPAETKLSAAGGANAAVGKVLRPSSHHLLGTASKYSPLQNVLAATIKGWWWWDPLHVHQGRSGPLHQVWWLKAFGIWTSVEFFPPFTAWCPVEAPQRADAELGGRMGSALQQQLKRSTWRWKQIITGFVDQPLNQGSQGWIFTLHRLENEVVVRK